MSVCCITEKDRNTNVYRDFREIGSSLSKEDIATVVETFESALEVVSSSDIENILVNSEGYFVFLLNDGTKESNFDFYEVLNSHCMQDVGINCANVKQLFPRILSRGLFSGYIDDNSTASVDDDEESTGFMDEEDLRNVMGSVTCYLKYLKTDQKVVISESGVIIGRSAKDASFVVKGNTNVSRNHCKVYKRNNAIYLKDNNSLNGTYVNGIRLPKGAEEKLDVGVEFSAADEKFVIE